MSGRAKARRSRREARKQYQVPIGGGGNGGWTPLVKESFAGAWQRNIEVNRDTALSFFAVYACITLIASDVGKMGLQLMRREDDIWEPHESSAFSPVLRKPNRYQTRQQFITHWMACKLIHGNAYILKQRDERGVVVQLYVLHPRSVQTMIASDGSVFYNLAVDELAGIEAGTVAVPASEIIHDRMVTLFHPLVGVSPIYACGLAAHQGLEIQNNSTNFFRNGSRPSGVLSGPEEISDETAARLKAYWEENYAGSNVGRVAVLGDGLKYEAMTMTAEDSQLIAQLKMSAEMVCSAYHVPAYKIGVGPMPTYQNAEVLNQIYYSDCLQGHIESIESLLDDGLQLPGYYRTEFELDDLLRMDSSIKMKTAAEGVKAAIMSPNEARQKFNLAPVTGGATPYLQQQNYSLEALDARDQMNPLATPGPNPGGTVDDPVPTEEQERAGELLMFKLANKLMKRAEYVRR
jgi:HK97 family phage portal protein